ncbi:hypothetical protein [Solirhodobacter olei]|uniref:hypothetical protein n=1 Tax=Solirhodobacter olei TaxID=2493082 RepID=UPI000FD87EE2|nr:hypothetical protein [Solirhodobacter olei]
MTGLERALYGTTEPAAAARALTAGPLSLSIEANMLRSLCWHGTELVRAISYPIRDVDWGTMLISTTAEALDPGAGTYFRRFETTDGALSGTLDLTVTATGRIEIDLTLSPQRDLQVNRAGFTILHPISDLAGAPIEISHADGSIERARFPEVISPDQPAREIKALAYAIAPARVEIEMEGEVFEMEDQRNWSDASYKTYCRPLALPFPYRLAAGAEIRQHVSIRFSGPAPAAASLAHDPRLLLEKTAEQLPEPSLAVEPGWSLHSGPAAAALASSRRLIRLDLRTSTAATDLLDALANTTAAYDIELVTADDAPTLKAQLSAIAAEIVQIGRSPEHVIALPAAYLASYQPEGTWPKGASPADARSAARATFPGLAIGGGMLTNFTELNRHRPDPKTLDYMSHGTTAIVHAADDVSVSETIEALPQIFRSARALAPEKPYRLGLVSIGMRSNPYGASTAPNPERMRKAMAMDDPRHGALFGAAWLLAAIAATEGAGVEAMALGAPAGPFGLVEADRLRPVFHLFRALQTMSPGRRLRPRLADRAIHVVAAALAGGTVLAAANLGTAPRAFTLPARARVRRLDTETLAAAETDPDWLTHAPAYQASAIDLPPFALAFAELDA